MNFGSVCSGIGAPEVAWSSLGWKPKWFSEIADFPSKVLAHHYPQVPNHGSLLGLSTRNVCSPVDIIVGGTPCQSFSVAGLRGGLADERGNLALEFARLVGALRPRWFVWENVPGVLSSGGGRDFGSILGALVELGYGLAWRVLDARYFGVPQRRRRVFVVGHLGDAAAAGAVLFEPESLRGDFAPSKKAREDIAGTLGGGSGGRGWAPDTDRMTFVPLATNAEGANGFTLTKSNLSKTVNNQTPRAVFASFDPTQVTSKTNRSSGDPRTAALAKSARPPHVAYSIQSTVIGRGENAGPDGKGWQKEESFTLDRKPPHAVALAFNARQDPISGPISGPIDTDGSTQAILADWRVRRLTPMECERLQGFPDGYTAIPGASDSARYAALGNSMAVPVLRWLGRRIEKVDGILRRAA